MTKFPWRQGHVVQLLEEKKKFRGTIALFFAVHVKRVDPAFISNHSARPDFRSVGFVCRLCILLASTERVMPPW